MRGLVTPVARVALAVVALTFITNCGDDPAAPEDGGIAQGGSGIALATASNGAGLTISTDKDDYAPGDTVWFTGTGWTAGDSLDIVLTDSPTEDRHEWSVGIGADGTFRDSTYVVDTGDLGVAFTLTATSRANVEQTLTVNFTDGQPNSVTVTATDGLVPVGGTATYDVAVTMGGNSNACTINLSATGLPGGTTASFTGNPRVLPAGSGSTNFNSTLSLVTTGATPPSTYTFTVKAARGTGCQGTAGDGPTATGTLAVFGAATKLAFAQQPSNTDATASITPAVTVQVLDANNNLVETSSASILMSIGTNPGSGTLSGTATQSAVNGVATFAGLSIDKAGTGYTLAASSSGLTGAGSNGFNITVGPAAKLVFSTPVVGGTAGAAFTPQPVVQVQDAGGNVKTTGQGSGASIALAIVPGTGASGAALSCTTNPLGASSGQSAFAGCSINLTGTGYRLRASATIGGDLFTVDSDPFDVGSGNQPPTVDAGTYNVAEGTELTLSPTVNDPDADALTYKWTVSTTGIDAGGACTFVDDTQKNAKLTCTDDSQGAPSGKFTLTLTVSDGHASPVADNADLTVTNADPTAQPGGPYTGNEGASIALSGAGGDPGDNDHITSYAWTVDFTGIDAGGTCTLTNPTSASASVKCTDDGSFKVGLTVTDDDGGTSTKVEANLTVNNVKPVAEAGGPYSGNEGDDISLSGSGSDVGDNDQIASYHWTATTTGIDAGGACTFSNANIANPTVKCTDDGSFKVALTVTDDDGASSTADEATLTVANVNPTADAGGTYSGDEGSAITLAGSGDDAGANDVPDLTYKWTITATGIDAGGACTFDDDTKVDAKVTCTDDSGAGTFSLQLVVKDDDGGTSSASTTTVKVANKKPEIQSFTLADGSAIPATVTVGVTLNLKVVFTDAGSNDTHEAKVDCGAGYGTAATATSPVTPSCTLSSVGSKTLQVKITDDDGGYAVASATVGVFYGFDGLFAPVDRPNTMNLSKAGQAVPLKWRLTDFEGKPILNFSAAALGVAVTMLPCDASATTDQIEEYAGNSGLQNLGDGYYQFNWKTPTNYSNSCRAIGLNLGEGTARGPLAYFNFKK